MTSKDTHDPGWNDPPTFTYDRAAAIQLAASNRKGTLLNKRVAFPVSGKICGSQSGSGNTTDKPPIMSIPPVSPSCLSTDNIAQVKSTEEANSAILSVKEKLREVLENLEIDKIEDDEIVKRIRMMEKMWKEDKLDETVQLKILELSIALANGDAQSADHIQKSLMVDKISQCSSWMSGFRHLINKKRLPNSVTS